MSRNFLLLLFILCVIVLQPAFAQNTDKPDTSKNIVDAVKDSKVSQEILKSVTRKQPTEVLNTKSEEVFLPYDERKKRKIELFKIDPA